jgi:tetratricopeptide (TPR) repeat protein
VHEIFISYSSLRPDFTRALAAAVEAQYGAGSVWWDDHLDTPGDYEATIRSVLNNAKAVVVIWTKEACDSAWVKSEAGRAAAASKLVNVRAPGLRWEDLPMPFERYNFRELEDVEGLLRIIAAVWSGTPPPTTVPLHELYFRQHGRRLIDPRQSMLPRDPVEISPVELLQARFAVVPYADVTGMKARILAWCGDSARATAGLLVHGPGGLGKTRLMIEVATELRNAGWTAGFLNAPYTDNVASQHWQALEQLIAHGDDSGLLIVMDYAEARQKELRELAGRLAARPVVAESVNIRSVRVVLLTRTAGEWWTMLHDEAPEIQRLFRRSARGPEVTALPTIATPEERSALFFASAEAMAPTLAAQGYAIPAGAPSSGRLARIEQAPDHARPLALQMEALLWLTSAVPDAGPVGVDELLGRVLGLERAHWGKLLLDDRGRVRELDASRMRDIRRGVAQVTAVQGTGSIASAERLLTADRFYGARRQSRGAVDPVLRDLLRLYAGPEDAGIRHLEPDLIGEHHVAMTADPDLIESCLAWIAGEPEESREKRRRDLLTVLQRATHPDHGAAADNAAALLHHLLSTHTRDLAGDLVAVMVDTPGALLGQLKAHVDELGEETLAAISNELPLHSLALMDVSLRIATQLADHARDNSSVTGEASEVAPDVREARLDRLAATLDNLGLRLTDVGRHEEALAASQEAAGIYRRLAETRPDDFLPDLATNLNNLGNRLSALDRREEALAASQEAVDVSRRLALARPDDFLSDLAMSLNNLGNHQSDLGRTEEAFAASREAVDIYRSLARTHPDNFLPDLAMSLNNLGRDLTNLGRREEALAPCQEAAGIHRRLADTRPDAFQPDLAMSLHNLSIRLSDLGRHEEALAAAQEAAGIHRCLADVSPDVFVPELAMSLGAYGYALGQARRYAEAVGAFREGLATVAPYAKRQPQAFGSMAEALREGYAAACEAAGTAPDATLLERVAQALQGFHSG